MNSVQKQYELKSRMFNNCKKIDLTEYFKFLDEIRRRKNQYIIPQDKKNIIIKRVINEPFKDPSVIEENRRQKERLYTIIDEKPLPKLNYEFLEVRDRIRNNKEKYREIAERALSVENTKFIDRVFNQKPRIGEIRIYKKLQKRYSKIMKSSLTSHYDDDENKKPSRRSENIILPNINGHKEGKNDKIEKIFQTEININNNNNNNSSENENEQSMENSEKMNEHKYNEISHQKQGHIK